MHNGSRSVLHAVVLHTIVLALGSAVTLGASPAWAQAGNDDKAAAGKGKAAGDTDKAAGDKAAGDKATGDKAAGDTAKAAGDVSEAKPPAASGQDQQSSAGAAAPNYTVKLKGLEQRVNELKERIFRSKARLNLLKETVLHGVIAGSRSVIRHVNEMGSSFRLVKLVYAIDGAQIYAKADESGSLDGKRKFDVFNGSIVPGNHTISVLMIFRGHGYGIFTYLKGYRFTVRASYAFTAAEGRQNVINVRAYEKGNATTELKDRPAIKFEASIYKVGKGAK